MQRPKLQRYDGKYQPNDINGEISILEVFDRFVFSILPCELNLAHQTIRTRFDGWNKSFAIDEPCHRDARMIYLSEDGPKRPAATQTALLMSEVIGCEGKKTLLVTSVADGYWTLVGNISKTIPGTHLVIEVSRPDLKYPRNAISAIAYGERFRVVYAMRDEPSWQFYDCGQPLDFEDVTHYRARIKKKRLTSAIIASYLKRMTYGSLRRDFWIDHTAPARLLAMPDFRLWRPTSNPTQ
jgi:hypothetical protein